MGRYWGLEFNITFGRTQFSPLQAFYDIFMYRNILCCYQKWGCVTNQDRRTLGREMTGKSHSKGFWGASNSLLLDLVATCMAVFIW